MALSRIATALGGLLISRGGRRFAGRHAGKLALATLAFELWQSRRSGVTPTGKPRTGQTRSQAHPRKRWSGRPS